MTVEIRPLERGDRADWQRLWTDYLTFYETKLPDEVYASTWDRLFAGGEFEPRGFIAMMDGQPVGLVEVMKLFNTIESDVSGTVVELHAENGQLVEFDQPLMTIRTA